MKGITFVPVNDLSIEAKIKLEKYLKKKKERLETLFIEGNKIMDQWKKKNLK